MSVQAMAWVFEHSPTEGHARLVLLSIANHAQADGTGAWPSYDTIAADARMSRRRAVDAVSRLERDGYVAVQRGAGPRGRTGRPTNLYAVVGMPSPQVANGDVPSPLPVSTATSGAPTLAGTTSSGDPVDADSGSNGDGIPQIVDPQRHPILKTLDPSLELRTKTRDPVFDAVAEWQGTPPGVTPTRALAVTIGTAVADIRSVHPDVTADEVRRRIGNMPPQWESAGPMALAKHWHSLDHPPIVRPGREDKVTHLMRRALEA